MAQLNFNDVKNDVNNTNQIKAAYFSLKNDGDYAVVRIMHDTVDSFDIVSKHQVRSDGKLLNINCVRNPSDPIDTCPLCASSHKLETKIFIHMVRYTTDENNQMVCTPVIWERSLAYARQLQSLIDEYGPLSDCVFKIVRHGAAGSKENKYSILFCNPKDYNETTCPKMADAFDGYKALGNVVFNKTPDEMRSFVQLGFFPKKEGQQTTATTVQQGSADNTQFTPPQGGMHQRPMPFSGGNTGTVTERPMRLY